MINPMKALKYMPKVGDMLLKTDGSYRTVEQIDGLHAALGSTEEGKADTIWVAFPHLRRDMIKGELFLIRSKNDEKG